MRDVLMGALMLPLAMLSTGPLVADEALERDEITMSYRDAFAEACHFAEGQGYSDFTWCMDQAAVRVAAIIDDLRQTFPYLSAECGIRTIDVFDHVECILTTGDIIFGTEPDVEGSR